MYINCTLNLSINELEKNYLFSKLIAKSEDLNYNLR